jgi:hypothetical protein
MGEVLSFKKKSLSNKSRSTRKAAKNNHSADERVSQGVKSSNRPKASRGETLNAESIKVWWISQEFDELIRKAVVDKHIPVEELTAVMAHRLGTLLNVSERKPELTLFCLKLISKITNQSEDGSNAS